MSISQQGERDKRYERYDGNFLEISGTSAVRSHQTFESNVVALCHHTGRYLTDDESDHPGLLLHEQHDFPGLQKFDKKFTEAAHSKEHQHLIYSREILEGLALTILGSFLFGCLWMLNQLADQVGGPLEATFFYLPILLGVVVGVLLLARGVWLLSQPTKIYHQRAKKYHQSDKKKQLGAPKRLGQSLNQGKRENQSPRDQSQAIPNFSPTILDFPLLSNYVIEAHEELKVNLGNEVLVPKVIKQNGHLSIELRPQEPEELQNTFEEFRTLYREYDGGSHIHAGTLALENVEGIHFHNSPLVEFDHRVVLRQKTPSLLKNGQNYSIEEDPLASFDISYDLKDSALYGKKNKQPRFPLECIPKLKVSDSYTLELHFHWLGDPDLTCILEECVLDSIKPADTKLGSVDKVQDGQYDKQNEQVIWRNLSLKNGKVVLKVSFKGPVRPCQLLFQGSYRGKIERRCKTTPKIDQTPYHEDLRVTFDIPNIPDIPQELLLDESVNKDEQQRFPLECIPKLKAYDSRTLELHFYWHGDQDLACLLEECHLNNPPELESVDKVVRGRYDNREYQVIWRNLAFQNGSLILTVSFDQPILESQAVFEGKYRCRINGLLSGLIISKERIWNALGLSVANEYTPIISRSTIFEGNIIVDTKRLMQEHEYVCSYSILCRLPAKEALVKSVLKVLVDNNIDLQRVEQATPRLDPAGTLDTQLRYWDIVGRDYNETMLDAVDVHVVISGSDRIEPQQEPNNSQIEPQQEPNNSQIDVRVRSLHDPRNEHARQRVKTLIKTLQKKLKKELKDKLVIRPEDTDKPVCVDD